VEPQEDKACTSLSDHIDHMGRLLAQGQKLLAHIDERRRLERGEDGFDGE
jgi:hypothetical protein